MYVMTAVYVCLSLFSVPHRNLTLLHRPGCNFAQCYRVPPSCALLGRFAIGARVWLLWQQMHLMRNISKDDFYSLYGWFQWFGNVTMGNVKNRAGSDKYNF